MVSGEAICLASRRSAQQLVAGLGTAQVRVIITARDLASVIASGWQQLVRNGRNRTLQEFLDSWIEPRSGVSLPQLEQRWEEDPGSFRWRGYALGSLVDRWQQVVGADQVTVVTVPGPGQPPHELWRRFVAAAGLHHRLPAEPPQVDERASNVGITEPEARAYLEAFTAAGGRWNQQQRKWLVDRTVASCLVARTDERGRRPVLPVGSRAALDAIVADDLQRLAGTGARVVGEVGDLQLRDATFSGDPVPDEHVRSALAHLTTGLADLARSGENPASAVAAGPSGGTRGRAAARWAVPQPRSKWRAMTSR